MDPARPSKRPTRLTYVAAGLWVAYFFGMAPLVPASEAFFEEAQVHSQALPPLTRLILSVPAFAWVLVGALGAAGLIGKSYALAPEAAKIVDVVALAGLVLVIAASALPLFVPMLKLHLSLAR